MKAIHIGALVIGLVVGYAIGARFPSTVPFIGASSGQ
jgi:hypothetical protein